MDLAALTALVPRLIVMAVLLLCSAFFAGSETALFSLSRVQRERLGRSERPRDRYVLRLLDDPRRVIATVLIGNEVVNVTFSALMAGVTRAVLPGWGQIVVAAVATGIAVPILLLFGEIAPKSIGLRVAEGWARLVARPVGFLAWALAPVRLVVTLLAGLFVRLLGGKPSGPAPRTIGADEFKALVEVGSKEGELEAEERRLIHNVFAFRDRTAAEIMTPAKKIFSLSHDLPLARIAAEAARSGFSRVPIHRGRRENVAGILFAKDLLGHSTGRLAGKVVKDLLRAPVYVPRTTKCDSLFREFQRTRTHMGLVVDEYGRLTGLVTMEDLLVELFGEAAGAVMIPLQAVFIVAGVCLLVEGFFSGSELAIVSADRIRLQRLAEKGDGGARLALAFLDSPQRLLATTLIGTNLAVVTSTTVITLAALERGLGEAIAVVALAPTLLILGEIVPKALCQQHADRWVTRLAYPLRLATLLFGPAVLLLGWFATAAARLLRVEEREALVTRDGFRILLESKADASAIPEAERAMISNVLDFGDRTVYDVMVPLSEVTALPEDTTLEEAAAEAADKQHTRIPIYRERIDQIVGVAHAFDLLTAETSGRKGTVADVARPAVFVPESKLTIDLLLELQRAGQQFAIVVDEYGGATGICTIEDILEQIVGEIEDEYDRGPSPIRPEGPNLWRVLARTPIAQINQTLQLDLPEGEDYETLGGLILDRMKRIPKMANPSAFPASRLTIVGVSERAIEEVRIRVGKKR